MALRKPGPPGAWARSLQALFFAFAFFLLGRASFNLQGLAESSGLASLTPLYFLAGFSSSPSTPWAGSSAPRELLSQQAFLSEGGGRGSAGAFSLQCAGSDRLRRLQELAEQSFNENFRRRQERLLQSVAAIEESKAKGVSVLPGTVSGLVKEMLASKAPGRGASQILTFVQQHPEFAEFRELMTVPLYSCPHQERLGAFGLGGAWVCLGLCGLESCQAAKPLVASVGKDAAALSFLRKGEASFEADAFSLLRADVHLFDSDLTADDEAELSALGFVTSHTMDRENPKAILATMRKLKASSSRSSSRAVASASAAVPVDFLRLDCGGCEGPFVSELAGIATREAPLIGQVTLKQYDTFQNANRSRLIFSLEALGYRLFHADEDPFNMANIYLSFVHESLVKPRGGGAPDASPEDARLSWPPLHGVPNDALQNALRGNDGAYARNVVKRAQAAKAMLARPRGMGRRHFISKMLLPPYSCLYEERLGLFGEGGKWLCLGLVTPAGKTGAAPSVISVGSRGDDSFELAVNRRLGAIPHTFDPFLSPETVKRMHTLPHLVFHPVGLTGQVDMAKLRAQHPTVQWAGLEDMFKLVGSDYVDILKIDCEGCEVPVVQEMAAKLSRGRPVFGQIQMEIHHLHSSPKMMALIRKLEGLGYRLYHAELNAYCGICYEVAFVHESLVAPR